MKPSFPSLTPTVRLRPGKEESLLRFHPWVFSGAIASIDKGVEEGDVVSVVDSEGNVLGSGHYQIGSIAVRMLTRGDEPLTDEFYDRRLEAALALRRALRLPSAETDAFRLVHGEGDYLPGLIVDIYGDTAVVQAHSPGMHRDRLVIADALTRLRDLPIRNVYYKSSGTLPYKAGLEPVDDYILGGMGDTTARENGLRFNVDWVKGQKTGFFIDQRDNRSLVERYAEGRNVLNMFCYTGGFSVYAMRGGARKVTSVDSSAKAIALTEANIRLNFDASDTRHTAVAEDAFKHLDQTPADLYDLIILDPPAFAKHRKALPNALRGYRKLNAQAFAKIAPGGILFTFSCSQAVTAEEFRQAVFTAAAMSGRNVRVLHRLAQPADHPVSIYHPEGEYLKGLVLHVE